MVEMTNNNPTLIKDQVASTLLEPLRAASVVLAAGPRMFDSSEPLRIPTLAGFTDPAWRAEGQAVAEVDVSFGELALMPSDRASISCMVRFTNELARQSHIALDSVLRDRLVSDVAFKLDTAMLVGDGANKSITGLLNQAGTQKAALDPSKPDTFLDAMAMLTAAEVTPSRLFMAPADFYTVRKVKDTSGRYILEADITKDATYRLFGVPVTVTNKLPAGKAILADMSSVAVVRDIAPTVQVLNELFAVNRERAILVDARYDLGLLRPQAVVVMSKAA